MCLDCEGIKAQGSFVGGPSSEERTWVVCTVNKLHYRTWHLSLCYGKPRADLVRKAGLTLCGGGVVYGGVDTCQLTESALSEGVSVPAATVSGVGNVTARESHEWSGWVVFLTTYHAQWHQNSRMREYRHGAEQSLSEGHMRHSKYCWRQDYLEALNLRYIWQFLKMIHGQSQLTCVMSYF